MTNLQKEEYKFLATERLLEKIINRAVDMNTHIIVGLGAEPPREYRDSFSKMAEIKILPKAFLERIIPSVSLRNRLVHEYDDTDPHIIYQSVFDALNQFPKYIEYIVKYIEKNKK